MLRNTRTQYPKIQKKADSPATNVEPLIIVDVDNTDFKAGIMTLADLQIQSHQDHLVMLKATCCLLQEHLTQVQLLKQTRQQKGWWPAVYRSTAFICHRRCTFWWSCWHSAIAAHGRAQRDADQNYCSRSRCFGNCCRSKDRPEPGKSRKVNILGFQPLTFPAPMGTNTHWQVFRNPTSHFQGKYPRK